jgi:gas vesicle protein
MFRHDSDSSAFATGLLAGAVVGAGLALLFAPKSGEQLRGDITDSVDALRDAVAERYRDLAERAGVQLDNLQARAERAADILEASAREVINTAAREYDRARGSANP